MAKKNKGNGNTGTEAAYESGRQSGSRRAKVAQNPVSALAGGFVVGALLGAVIPATSRERRALQPVGSKLSDAAQTAARGAAEKGRDKLNRLTGEVVTQVGSKVIDAVAPTTA
jgi:hypothetical protein